MLTSQSYTWANQHLGIFMALITAVILLAILSVGIRALGSLEVSYGAFEKDMGPAAQKKNQ